MINVKDIYLIVYKEYEFFDLENNINERVRLLYVELTRAIDLGYFVVPKVNEDDDEVKDLYDCNKQTDFINYYKTEVKSIDISSLLNENTKFNQKNQKTTFI